MKKIVLLITSFFTMLIIYQNCSVYKSEGLTLLEQKGINTNSNEQQKILAKTTNTCENLDDLAIENLFTTKDFAKSVSGSRCLIETQEKAYECGINNQLEKLYLQPQNYDEIFDSFPELAFLNKEKYQQLVLHDYKHNNLVYIVWPISNSDIWYCQSHGFKESLEEDALMLGQLLELLLN